MRTQPWPLGSSGTLDSISKEEEEVYPRLTNLFFVTRQTKGGGGCYNRTEPSMKLTLVSIARYGPPLSIHTKMSTIGQGVT